jgi:hypothetical protein
MARDVTAVTSNLMLSHETSAETLLSALQKGLLISRQSLAPKRFVRGDEEGDESCEKTRCIARGEMNPAMVGFRMTGECTGFALMQFEAVTYVAHNVFRFTKAREPTAGRRRAFHRLSLETDILARGDKRPQAATR